MTAAKLLYPIRVIKAERDNKAPWLDCGNLSTKQIKQYLQEIADNKTIPVNSCVHNINAKFRMVRETYAFATTNGPITDNHHTVTMGGLDISVCNRYGCKCHREHCFENLASGKCTDEFMIKIIGKKFFADKYTNKR